MRKQILTLIAVWMAVLSMASCSSKPKQEIPVVEARVILDSSLVYVTRDITPESLIRVFQALNRPVLGRVAVKISTGEAGNPNSLSPELIAPFVRSVGGTLVECCTAYGGKRSTVKEHRKVIHDHGYDRIAHVDLMDEDGEYRIPVRDTTWIKYDIVGDHLARYDFMVNLAHFKGHPMGGLGGVIKNQSIGVASANGKAYIHTAGLQNYVEGMWEHVDNQDGFLESMAAAAQAVADLFGNRIVYISVMNNMSVDCDCVSNPEKVQIEDYGILASLDPVALDQACVDIVFGMEKTANSDNGPLMERISSRHGTHTIEWAEKIGLGSRSYKLISID